MTKKKENPQLRHLSGVKKAKPYDEVIALDIETSSEGELLDIGLYTVYNGNILYDTFIDWASAFRTLLSLPGNWRVLAHNGWGFDYIGLTNYIMESYEEFGLNPEEDIKWFPSESQMVACTIKTETTQLTIIDTIRFFPGMSLDKIAESMFNEHKEDIPHKLKQCMENVKRFMREEYYAYLQKDCELLYRIYIQFRENINKFIDVGELSFSSGGTAMLGFRRHLHSINPKLFVFAPDRSMLAAAEIAMRGGFTAYVGNGSDNPKHYYPEVTFYDVGSMYPEIQQFCPVPTSPMVLSDGIVYDRKHIRPGWYIVDFKQTKGYMPIFYDAYIDWKKRKETEHPVWEGTGLLCHFELEALKEIGKIVKVHQGIIYEDYQYPFESFLDPILEGRFKAKHGGEDALALAYKIIMNSLYGKFAQKFEREQVAITGNMDWYESKIKAEIYAGEREINEYFYNGKTALYGVRSESTSFSNRFIGAMITAHGRLKIGLAMNTVRCIYGDTDSLATQDQLSDLLIGDNPGEFAIQKTGKDLICVGKKAYAYGDEITFKGIPKNSLSQKQMLEIAEGAAKRVEYRSPTAFKTALKKKVQNPNKFIERHRTVKLGDSMKDSNLLRLKNPMIDAKIVAQILDSFRKI